MFQFPRSPSTVLCVQTGMTGHDPSRVSPFGYPRIKAWSTAPRGFSQPPTSFIGIWRQGIHRWLFVAWDISSCTVIRCSCSLCSSQGTVRLVPPGPLEAGPGLVSRRQRHAPRGRAALPRKTTNARGYATSSERGGRTHGVRAPSQRNRNARLIRLRWCRYFSPGQALKGSRGRRYPNCRITSARRRSVRVVSCTSDSNCSLERR